MIKLPSRYGSHIGSGKHAYFKIQVTSNFCPRTSSFDTSAFKVVQSLEDDFASADVLGDVAIMSDKLQLGGNINAIDVRMPESS